MFFYSLLDEYLGSGRGDFIRDFEFVYYFSFFDHSRNKLRQTLVGPTDA